MTGYGSPGAGPHTGPATLKAPPAGRGATTALLPVAGSMTPTLAVPTYAMRPCDSAPVTSEGLTTTAAELLPHALSGRARRTGMEGRRSHWVMKLRSLSTRVSAERFRSPLTCDRAAM